MQHFEMYWITNRHHDHMKFLRKMQRDRLCYLVSRLAGTVAKVAIVLGVLRWLAGLGV
jgi:hypothetical protein